MARSRSIPTSLFDDPRIFDLPSETQIVLLGLVLQADDHGRGLKHAGLLARKINKECASVEQALIHLEQVGLVQFYQDEQYQYYALTCWTEWQTLHKPARSKYPAPPQQKPLEPVSTSPEKSGEHLENPGESRKSSLEEEAEEEGEEEKEAEGEVPVSNIVPFPSTDTSGSGGDDVVYEDKTALLHQVARILKVPESDALQRIVAEYQHDPDLSLLHEADAAREWIDDPGRNRKRSQMNTAFFRRWLNREKDAVRERQKQVQQRQVTPDAPDQNALPRASGSSLLHKSLMDLEAQYQTTRAQGGR